MNKPTIHDSPQTFISGLVHLRLNAHVGEFTRVLLGEDAGKPRDDIEANQMVAAKKLVPAADDIMALIVSRLITHFVKDPAELVRVMNERHYETLGNYAWLLEGEEEAIRQQHANGQGEGASIFWLSYAINEHLLGQEAHLRGAYAPCLYSNRWQYLAVRALLRLQTLLINMDELTQVEVIHGMHWAGQEMKANYAPAIPKPAVFESLPETEVQRSPLN